MLDHLRTKFKSSLSPEDLPGKPVMIKKETVLYRGQVLKIDTVHSKGAQVFATCRLVDFGTVHHISTTNIEFLIHQIFRKCCLFICFSTR